MNKAVSSLFVSILIRGCRYGYVVELHPEDFRVMRKRKIQTKHPLAQHGGAHGLAYWGEDIVTGTYDTMYILDRDLNVVSQFSHPLICGVHGIDVDESTGLVWVTSCNNDHVLAFDRNGDLKESFNLFSIPVLRALAATTLPALPDPTASLPYEQQPFHVNHVQILNGDILICLHKQGLLWNLSQNKAFAENLGERIHDAQQLDGKLVANDTGNNLLREVAETTREVRVDFRLPTWTRLQMRCRAAFPRFLPQTKAHPFWLRGICPWGEDTYLVGSSPASVSEVSVSRNKVIRTSFISTNLRHAVFGILGDPGRRKH